LDRKEFGPLNFSLVFSDSLLGDLPVPVLRENDYEKVAHLFDLLSEQQNMISVSLENNKKLMNSIING